MYKTDARLTDVPDDTVIWRYMNFTSFYSLLLNRSLFFRRLDQLSDAFEGTLPEETAQQLYRHRLHFDWTTKEEADRWMEKNLATIAGYKAHILSNSWSMNTHEDYALWKIYLQHSMEGVALKSTVGQLKQCLALHPELSFYSGKVRYEALDYKHIDVFTVATNKRPTYAFEREYRALLFHQFTIPETGEGRVERVPKFDVGAEVAVDLMQLIGSVYVSPFASAWFYGLVCSALQHLLPSFPTGSIICSGIRDR